VSRFIAGVILVLALGAFGFSQAASASTCNTMPAPVRQAIGSCALGHGHMPSSSTHIQLGRMAMPIWTFAGVMGSQTGYSLVPRI